MNAQQHLESRIQEDRKRRTDRKDNIDYRTKCIREEAEKMSRITSVLAEHGIEMSVRGCGCCGSPNVEFRYQGRTIINESDVNFDMIDPPPTVYGDTMPVNIRQYTDNQWPDALERLQ